MDRRWIEQRHHEKRQVKIIKERERERPARTIHGHFINLCAVVLLNVAQDLHILARDKVDGGTLATKSA